MSKLEFNITEIPEGESTNELRLAASDFELPSCRFEGGTITINFYKSHTFIRARYQVGAELELICDRCLEPFIYPVHTSYEVIFKPAVQQEIEDEDTAVRELDFSTNTLNVEKEVRDSILLEVPMQKIHPKFLDEKGNIKDFDVKSFGGDEPEEDIKPIDPRWEKLKKLKQNH